MKKYWIINKHYKYKRLVDQTAGGVDYSEFVAPQMITINI